MWKDTKSMWECKPKDQRKYKVSAGIRKKGPGYHKDSDDSGPYRYRENITEIAVYISGTDPDVSYEILNYNPLAEAKYHLIGKEFCFAENPKMYSKSQMKEFESWARQGGVSNVIMEI